MNLLGPKIKKIVFMVEGHLNNQIIKSISLLTKPRLAMFYLLQRISHGDHKRAMKFNKLIVKCLDLSSALT